MPDTLTKQQIEEIRARLEADDVFRFGARDRDSKMRITDVYGELDHRLLVSIGQRKALLSHISALEQAADDAPPPADAALLAAANRALMERVERLERVLAAEQGREGLEGWEWHGDMWQLPDHEDKRLGPPPWKARAWPHGRWYTRETGLRCNKTNALEAMEAAEAALRGTP